MERGDDAAAVVAVEEHWPTALADRDGPWLRAHTTEDFVFIGDDGVIMEREAYLGHREEENDEVISGGNRVDRVTVVGDAAVVVGRSQFVCRDREGRTSELRFRYSGVYLREHGRWRASVGQLSAFSGSDDEWGDDLLDRTT